MTKQNRLAKYHGHLEQLPAAGYGHGYHTGILGAANLGLWAGRSPEQITQDIRNATKPGKRIVPDREIWAAVERAAADFDKAPMLKTGSIWKYPASKPKPFIQDPEATLRHIIEQGTFSKEADLLDASPIRINWCPREETSRFLSAVFDPSDFVFIGKGRDLGIPGKNIRRAADWIRYFEAGGIAGPYIIVNPLTAKPAPKKDGNGMTYRGDLNILTYRHCLVEFDNLTHENQIRFWSSIGLSIRALIDSGGKSIHAWLDVSKLGLIETPEQWKSQIKERLYDKILAPLGVDAACSNPARLSRLPGHYRSEKQAWQRLLWLSPEGRVIKQ